MCVIARHRDVYLVRFCAGWMCGRRIGRVCVVVFVVVGVVGRRLTLLRGGGCIYKGRPLPGCSPGGASALWCGGALLSRTLSGGVSLPCQVLASRFGMVLGVSPGPWPPQVFLLCVPTGWWGGLCGCRGTGWWTPRVIACESAVPCVVKDRRLQGECVMRVFAVAC